MTSSAVTEAPRGDAVLRVSLSGIAELARVQRPVVSMWRTRYGAGPDAFPSSIGGTPAAPIFDAGEVARWLAHTGRGNNPDAVADVAAAAAPDGFSFADPAVVDELAALVALQARYGRLSELTSHDLMLAAASIDPNDTHLRTEVERHVAEGRDWTAYTDALVDSAYSPTNALDLIHAKHSAHETGVGSTAALTNDATDLLSAMTAALVAHDTGRHLLIGRGIDPRLAARLVRAVGDEHPLTVLPGAAARGIRRRLLADGIWPDDDATGRSVRIARVPTVPRLSIAAMLAEADDVALHLADGDVGLVVGPARALVDALDGQADLVRSDVLRGGRLRAAVRLPANLVTGAAREALGVWVLGPPTGDVPLGERFTATADLTDTAPTRAAREDLVSDVLAAIGSARDVRAHAFRFAVLQRTSSLLARSGSLVGAATRRARTDHNPSQLPALIDEAAQAVAGDLAAPRVEPATAPFESVAPALLGDLIHERHARVIAGTRLADADGDDTGLVVVTAADLDDPTRIGARRIDALTFALRHPHAPLTRPGDVVFRTSPTAAAWVDTAGSSVVAYPARVLRIDPADPGGLVPEIVAADIAGQASGPGTWRRWMLRRVTPDAIAGLRRTLADIAAARDDLRERIARLDAYRDVLTAGVVAGAITLSDSGHPTAAANEEHDAPSP
ncbi:hypothetical protein ACQ143_00250 [Microbacterium sp. MC2]